MIYLEMGSDDVCSSFATVNNMVLNMDRDWTSEDEQKFCKWLSKTCKVLEDSKSLRKDSYYDSEPPTTSMPLQLLTSDQSTSLPSEVILHILSYIPRITISQPTLHACTLVSRAWYAAALPILYHTPFVNGTNFKYFVRTACPSINAHVRENGLANLVRSLDMGNLVHDGSKSLTARILGRVKGGLEEFVAPQASFGCVTAISGTRTV